MIPEVSAEDDLIARHFAPLAGAGGLGLEDDAALLAVPAGQEIVLTKDMLVAGIHFFADDPPGSIARKALRVNLSDLAAKGAEPLGFLLGLGLPDSLKGDGLETWLAAFAASLGEDARAFACPLLGGDTVASPEHLTLSITALGMVPAGRMLRRTAAKPGDAIYVTGTIGDAALGLQARLKPDAAWVSKLAPEHKAHLLERYLHPQPRNALAKILRRHAHAAMDVSDGLAGDLARMMRVSGVGADVVLDDVPLSPAARAALMADPALAQMVFTGGDDYEILCTVPPVAEAEFIQSATTAGIAATRIGTVTDKAAHVRFHRQGAEIRFARGSYSHI